MNSTHDQRAIESRASLRHPRWRKVAKAMAALIGVFVLVQPACTSKQSETDEKPGSANTLTTAAPNSSNSDGDDITQANVAYYFDNQEQYVAGEALDKVDRKIEKSKTIAPQDGLDLLFASTCQQNFPDFKGKTEMIGKASIAIYAASSPDNMRVIAVEDLGGVTSRIIDPMQPVSDDDDGVCCCALVPCGDRRKCCPCQSTC